MISDHAHERFRQSPQNKEEYLESFERTWKNIHEGKPPELGLMKKGSPERKTICEDVKLKKREKGLFLIADGVSAAQGWFASRETARMMYEILGERLDQGVENMMKQALRDGTDPLERITGYVAAQMSTAVEQADSHIKATGAVRPEFHGSSTTLSMAKLMELPDAKGGSLQRLFFTNVGDSRIYIQRKGGGLQRVTRDDSRLQMHIDQKELTQEQEREIDQAWDPARLAPNLRRYTRGKAVITKSIGIGNPPKNLDVFFLDLHPGDRLVIVSDGISDQMLESEITYALNEEPDDDQAETRLQQEAMDMALDGSKPRAKGDDISAVVYTVGERGPDRSYLHQDVHSERTQASLQETLARLQLQRETLREENDRSLEVLARMDLLTPKSERLALLLKIEEGKQREHAYAYHLEKTQLDILEMQIPSRFQIGEQVKMWREDFDPPSFDRVLWAVVSYDSQSKTYRVRGSGGVVREISRYELETIQTGLMVRLGDELPVVNELGAREQGFTIRGFDKDGTVILVKEENKVIKRLRMKVVDVNTLFYEQLSEAQRSRQRMIQAAQNYQEAVRHYQAYKKDVSE